MATGFYNGACIERHTAEIYDRGGARRIGPLIDISSLAWERNRDGVSEATLRIEGEACSEQAEFLQSLRCHRHELVIYRGSLRVWEGPLHRIGWHRNYVEVVAHDVIEYLMFQPLTREWSNVNPNITEVTTRIGNIIDYELTTPRDQIHQGVTVQVDAWEDLDPPINVLQYLQVHHFANEAETAALTVPFEMTVGEHLHGLARASGIDFTAVGRAIHIWDVSRALGRTAMLTDENFLTEVVVTEYGADHVQAAYVIADDDAYGSALEPRNLDYYGPWTKVYTVYNEEGTDPPTTGELNSQARRNVSGRSPVPVEVRIPDNSGVILSDAIGINDLVPGVQVPLVARLNARQFSQMQKIDHVRVSETSDGETVELTLIPIAREDPDEELPDEETFVQVLFPGNSDYRLEVRASNSGDTVQVKANVAYTGPQSAGVAGTDQPWSITIAGTTYTGEWDYKFKYYRLKTAGVKTKLNVPLGMQDFSATVTMGSGVGTATASGTIEVQ